MTVYLLKKTFQDVEHDASPGTGIIIKLKIALYKKVAITKQTVTNHLLQVSCQRILVYAEM